MRKDNRGFSLVELIIVMAIMAVLGGVMFMGVGMISGKPADKCAEKLKAVIQSSRVTTMGRTGVKLELYRAADGRIMSEQTTSEGTKESIIGDADVTVEVDINDSDSLSPLGSAASPLVIEFDRSTGALKNADKIKIEVSRANTTRVLILYGLTGKIELQ